MPNIIRTGGGGAAPEIFNFPLTISPTQPTPISAGHLWVEHAAATDFSNIVLDDAVKVSYTNGYLMLIVDDTNNGTDTFAQPKNVGGTKIPFTSYRDTGNDTTLPWQVGSVNKGGTIADIKRKYPLVYSRLNNVLDMETAKVWDGTQWVLICQPGSYLAVGVSGLGNQPPLTYNRANTLFTLHSSVPSFPSTAFPQVVKWSHDGNYVFYGLSDTPYLIGYKRTGDTFTLLTITAHRNWPVMDLSFSPDDNYLAACSTYSASGVDIYKKQSNGNWLYLTTTVSALGTGQYFDGIDWSPDGNQLVGYGAHISTPCLYRFKRSGDTFTKLADPTTTPHSTISSARYSPDGQFILINSYSNFMELYRVVSDTQLDMVQLISPFYGRGDSHSIFFLSANTALVVMQYGLQFVTISELGITIGSQITSIASSNVPNQVAMSLDKKIIAAGYSASPYLKLFSFDGSTVTQLTNPTTMPVYGLTALDLLN